MRTPIPGFCGVSYTTTPDYENQRTINLFPEKSEASEKDIYLRAIPGLSQFKDGLSGIVRGLYQSFEGRLFAAINNKLVSISSTGTITEIGTLKTNSGRVHMVDNGIGGLCVVDGPHGYFLEYSVVRPIEHFWHSVVDPSGLNIWRMYFYSPNHSLSAGNQVKLTGVPSMAGTYTVGITSEDIFHVDNAITYFPSNNFREGTITTKEDNASISICSVTGHGYTDGQQIVISPNTYVDYDSDDDHKFTVDYVDANTFEIALNTSTWTPATPIQCDEIRAMTWELTTERFSNISNISWRGSNYVEYQDGYYIFSANTEEGPVIYFGEDPLHLDALDFTVATDQGDGIVRCISDHGTLWVLREKSAVVYINTGVATNVWQPQGGTRQEAGCISGDTVVQVGGRIIWLSQDRNGTAIVMGTQGGFQGVRISNSAVEQSLKGLDLSESTAWAYQEGGHAFYCLNCPGLETTWVLDVGVGAWCERGVWANGLWTRYQPEHHVYSFGKHLVSSYNSTRIWEMDTDLNSWWDGSNKIANVWMRQAPYINSEDCRVFHHQVILNMEAGQLLDQDEVRLISWPTLGSTFDPVTNGDTTVLLSYSDDGGRSWIPDIQASSGTLGEYRKRLIWRRLGQSRDRIYRFTGSLPVKHSILGAWLDADKGAH